MTLRLPELKSPFCVEKESEQLSADSKKCQALSNLSAAASTDIGKSF